MIATVDAVGSSWILDMSQVELTLTGEMVCSEKECS
jgi:hypothetical protein